MPAEELLATTSVAPLALVGQTQIARPEVILPTVVTRLRHVTDLELRSRLFTALLALLPAEEMITMVRDCSNTKIWSWSCRTYGAFAKKAAKKATKKAGARVRRRCCSTTAHPFWDLAHGCHSTRPCGGPETLLHWSERVLSAATLMRSSLRDIALAGQDGVEGLVGLGKDAKHVVRLTDEEHQTLRLKPRTLVVAWTARLVVIACSQVSPHVLGMVLTGPLGLPTMPGLAAEGLRTCVVMTRSSVRTSGHEEVWVCCTTQTVAHCRHSSHGWWRARRGAKPTGGTTHYRL